MEGWATAGGGRVGATEWEGGGNRGGGGSSTSKILSMIPIKTCH